MDKTVPSAACDWWPEQLLENPIRRVYVCGRQTHPPLYSYVVNFPRLEIPIRGCYENQIEEDGQATTISLRPGMALFAPPNCWNLPTWRLSVEVMSLLFGKKQLGISIVTAEGPKAPQLVSKFSIPRPLTGPLPHLLEAMIEMQRLKQSHDIFPDLTRALLRYIRHLVTEAPSQEASGRAQSLLERACIYLQNHYQHDITRDTVAQQFGVTPNHLSRLFQSHGSMTFSNYLSHVRIDRAKHLLSSYDLKLDDIAARCGYRDTPYFCRVFKHLARVTPAEYRTRVRAQLEKSGAVETDKPA